MYRDSSNYEKWTRNAQEFLDELVARNFSRLYAATGREKYNDVWGDINSVIYRKYGLLEKSNTESEAEKKEQQRYFISSAINIYSEEDFPHQLRTPETLQFVKKYKKLPKQLPNQWRQFKKEHSKKEDSLVLRTNSLLETLKEYSAKHPEYSYR